MTEILNLEYKSFLYVFLRIGAAIMLMPGFMTSYINMQFRLSIAISLTVILIPILGPEFSKLDTSGVEFVKIILFEITIGVFFGLLMQILYASVNLAGNIAGQGIGFSNAQVFEPSFNAQSIVIQSFLAIIAITIIFITNMHHLMLSAVIDSYALFPAGAALPIGDLTKCITENFNESFIVGFKIGSPFIAFIIIFYVGMGLVSRLMPQLNIFFLSLPLQIYLGLGLLLLTTPIMIMWFVKYYEETLQQFLR